jgi:hypothetical protein
MVMESDFSSVFYLISPTLSGSQELAESCELEVADEAAAPLWACGRRYFTNRE